MYIHILGVGIGRAMFHADLRNGNNVRNFLGWLERRAGSNYLRFIKLN